MSLVATDSPPPPPPPPPAPRRRRRWRWLGWTLAAVGVIAVIIAAGAYWILATPGGAQFVLSRAAHLLGKGTRIEGVEGRIGGVLKVRSIEIDEPDLFVRIDDIEIDSSPPFGGRLAIHKLVARNVEVRTASSKAAARVPVSFKPPYPVSLEDGRVGTLRLGTITPEEKAAPDGVAKAAARAASRNHDLVLHDIAVRGAGDKSRWQIDEARVAGDFGAARISGTLGNAGPYPVDLKGSLEGVIQERAYRVAASVGGTLQSLEAKVEGVVADTRASAKAVLEPFAALPLKSLTVDAADVDLSRLVASAPRTRMSVHAALAAKDAKTFTGPVRIVNVEPGPWDRELFPFLSAGANVTVMAGHAALTGLDVALLGGGSARGSATLDKSGAKAHLQVADVDLAALHRGLQKTRVAGRIAIDADRGGQRFDVVLADPRFQVEGHASLANRRLDIATARVRTGGGAMTGQGTMALDGRRDFRFTGNAQHFDPSAFVKATKGDLNFAFVATGTLTDGIAGEASLDIAPSTYAGLPAAGRLRIAGDRRRIASSDVDMALGEARLTAKGSFGRAGDAMQLAFRAPNLSVIAKAFGLQMAGRVEGTATLTGTFQSPAGSIALTGANLALPSDVYVRELALRLEAGVEESSSIDGLLTAKGVAMGKATPPTPMADSASATLKGTRGAHRLEIDAVMSRDTTVRAAFAGGVDPKGTAFAWNGRVESLAMTGREAFTLAAPAPLTVALSRIELGDSTLRGEWGEVRLAVTRWTPRTLDFKGATSGLQVQNVARSFRLGALPRSDLVVAGDWDLHGAETFDGTLNVRRVSGDLRLGEPALPLGLTDLTVRAEAVRGRAKASVNVIGARIGRIQGEGAGVIAHGATGWEFAQASPVEGRLNADIPDLQALAAWLGPDAKLGGELHANVTVSGTGADPRVAGQARAQNLVVREPASGFEIAQGDVALRFDGKSLAIERFVAKTPWRPAQPAREHMRNVDIPADGGTITAEGAIDLAARRGAIRVKADKVPFTQLPTRFLAMSGEAQVEAGETGVVATGAFKADGGWIGALAEALPTISEDVVVIRAAQPAAAEPARPKEPMRIDVRLSLNDRVWFEGRGLDTRLTGDVHVTGEVGGALRANGVIRTLGGTYEGYGQKLAIERGILSFSGPLDNPQLNVLALRKGLAVEAGVEILGTTTRPRIRLVSSPDVPEPEKLSWLVLGRAASDASPGDMSVMMAAAGALLGGSNPGSDLSKRFGIDDVKIGRADTASNLGVLPQSTVAGRTGTPSASEVVSVGKRLNRNLYLTYEQGLADAEGALKITWSISRQFQVLARAGFLPGLDAVYRWTFK